MGRRPGDAEGDWAGLGEDDSGNLAKLAPDLLHQRFTGERVRLASLLAFGQQGFHSRGSGADEPLRTLVEAALPCLACIVPGLGNVTVAFGACGEAAIDQPKRMADARQPGNRLGVGKRARLRE